MQLCCESSHQFCATQQKNTKTVEKDCPPSLAKKFFQDDKICYGVALKNFKPALLLCGLTIFRGGGTEIPSTLCVYGATVTILRRYTCKIYLLSNRQLRCESSHQFCATQ